MAADAVSPEMNKMRTQWSLVCWCHSQTMGGKPKTNGVHQSFERMKSGLRHWERNFLGCLEGCFLNESGEASGVEEELTTECCQSSFSGYWCDSFWIGVAWFHLESGVRRGPREWTTSLNQT